MDTECGPKYRTRELVLTCPGYGYSFRGTVKEANMPYYKTHCFLLEQSLRAHLYLLHLFIYMSGSRACYSVYVKNRGQLKLSGSAQAPSPAQLPHLYCIINS